MAASTVNDIYILHETDNVRVGANADAHGRLQASGNSRQASWNYTVDDKEVVQSFSDNTKCWAAGNRYYNENGIQIEICVNSDGNFKKAVANAIELVKYLMKKYNIPASRVLQHNNASGKNCPRNLRSGAKGITWNQFKKDITKTGGLTVSQYKELKDENKKLRSVISTIKRLLKDKLDVPSNNQAPTKDHEDSVKDAKSLGITNGSNPRHYATKEQTATMIVNLVNNSIKNNSDSEEYAKEALKWAKEYKVSNIENPAYLASRQQVITMIKRAIDLVMETENAKEDSKQE